MSDTHPYRVFNRHLSLENLTCSRDGTPSAQLKLVLYIERYSSVVGRALDGSMMPISTDAKLVERRVNTLICDPLKFIEDGRYSEIVVREVLSCPGVNLARTKFVSRLLSFVKENVSSRAKFVSRLLSFMKGNVSSRENIQWSQLKVEGTFKCLTRYVYDEGLAIALAVRSSEEEQRQRKLQMAIETKLIEEREWGSNEGTCGVCLETFEFGERLDRMPCSHYFHKDCVRKWLIAGKSTACPLCRFAIE